MCSHYLHMERYCMKRIFFMVTCLLLTVASAWGEPAQSTLNLNVEIPSDEIYTVYSSVDEGESFQKATLNDTVDLTSEVRKVYRLYYQGNQAKRRTLSVTITASSFKMIEPARDIYVPVAVQSSDISGIGGWSTGSTPVTVVLSPLHIDAGKVLDDQAVDNSIFTVGWAPFQDAPAGAYQAEIKVEMKFEN